jgi:hypothetical protein
MDRLLPSFYFGGIMHRWVVVAAALGLACGTSNSGSSSTGTPVSDAGTVATPADAGGASADAGSPAGDAGAPGVDAGGPIDLDAGSPADAGSTGGDTSDAGIDGGSAPDGGTTDGGTATGSADGGTDGGTATGPSAACNGLIPGTPGGFLPLQLTSQDLVTGSCQPGESDGTGHIALSWQDNFQPHDTHYTFFEPAHGANVGSYTGISLPLIGQFTGFMGAECRGANCQQDVVVLGPTGTQLFMSPTGGRSNGLQANNPAGGIVHARLQSTPAGDLVLLDSVDPTGAVRWTQALPDPFAAGNQGFVRIGVDRAGNTLALWESTARFGAGTWAGEWFDPTGVRGPVFLATTGVTPDRLFERVGSGLFLTDGSTWIGEFDALGTTLAPPPAWLVARPNTLLHMVRNGTGYAVLPKPGASAVCQQSVEVLAPSGESCGAAVFPVDGAACTTSSITVGYEGTVVQQLPREREAACTAAGHSCNCTWHAWSGFFH